MTGYSKTNDYIDPHCGCMSNYTKQAYAQQQASSIVGDNHSTDYVRDLFDAGYILSLE